MHANEDIAKALGWRLSDEPIMYTRCWVDQAGAIVSCGEKLPDFTLPEWLPAIKERVEDLCSEQKLFIREIKHPCGARLFEICEGVLIDGLWMQTDNCLWFVCNVPPQSAWIEALMWLTGRGRE